MKNIEILGFQFEPTKALQPDTSSGKSWETYSSVDSKPSTTRRSEASVDTWYMCFNCSQIFQQKEVVHLFTPNSASFLHQINQ